MADSETTEDLTPAGPVDFATDPGEPPTSEGPVFVDDDTVSREAPPSEERTDNNPVGPPLPMPARIGRFEVRRLLGEGGFGRVYHAWDGKLDRDVAVKVPRAGAFITPRHAEAFAREARLAAGLKHPSIVTVFDIGYQDDGSLFVVLEYIEGQSLSDLLRAERVSHRRLAELLALVAEALEYAHSKKLIHRDLKPANLIVDVQGRPHVTDFGLAVHEEGVRTMGRQVAGTLHYMAPEQVRGESHRLVAGTDVWSLGVVLYQMLTGRLPFAREERANVIEAIIHRDPRPPRRIDPGLPPELERICMKCLAKRVDDRYPTASALADDLWHWVWQAEKGTGLAPLVRGGAAESALTDADAVLSRERVARVIPKGLRAFDADDEAFFPSLLPGPFDRDGLPDCLRFWKTRAESTDPDVAFPVGLLFGPSGSGKSSLIKAGLLPRLASGVRPIYVEATPEGTEARLARGLRRAYPNLPDGLTSAAEVIGVLRETPALRRGKKLFLVIDQFEQWLLARRPGPGEGLVEALRQCDGVSVQCLLMTRDDFGTAALRFMSALEVRLEQGKNCALVDRFDALHAMDVLCLFGRALGRLPEEGPLTDGQEQFLEQAVAGMAADGKVSPVRLALFVEMFRGREWGPESLARVGGTEGIGVTFLEESLGSAVSSPSRRAHSEPARAVLQALLPAPGVNIKGHMRPYSDLLAVSGYGGRIDAFDDLLRTLGNELRLISPCDTDRDGGGPLPLPARSFQLTHDYLVPSLRKWLAQERSASARGRAGLLLENLAAVWSDRPSRRYLPTAPEWLWICLMARPSTWAPGQSRMMRAAAGYYLAAIVVAGLLAAALAGAGVRITVWLEGGEV